MTQFCIYGVFTLDALLGRAELVKGWKVTG